MVQNVFESIKSAYGNLLGETNRGRAARLSEEFALSRGEHHFAASADSGFVTKSAANVSGAVVGQGHFQRILRPIYGKEGINPAEIGHHPDFKHLLNTQNGEYCPITTMFMDMKGSTRLGIVHDPPTVFKIKNTFLSLAIEIIKAFDGHVHRLQGDAVMAYFGGKKEKPEQGIIDAINCATTLMQIVKLSVIPALNERYAGTPLGVRIGLDHGEHDDVYWGCYGQPNMCEVTATSLYVDMAAKLQQAAGANQIMLGEMLRSQFDLHDQLLALKKYTVDGIEYEQPVVEPNHTDVDGNPINYKQHLLRDDVYFEISPLVPHAPKFLPASGTRLSPLTVKATLHASKDGSSVSDIVSCGSPITKGRWLAFRIEAPGNVAFPCTVKYRVENHGQEARRGGGENYGNHPGLVRTVANYGELATLPPNWEQAAWRGLHYLIAEISVGSIVSHRGTFGVFIEG